jgi:hypothetical protein
VADDDRRRQREVRNPGAEINVHERRALAAA